MAISGVRLMNVAKNHAESVYIIIILITDHNSEQHFFVAPGSVKSESGVKVMRNDCDYVILYSEWPINYLLWPTGSVLLIS